MVWYLVRNYANVFGHFPSSINHSLLQCKACMNFVSAVVGIINCDLDIMTYTKMSMQFANCGDRPTCNLLDQPVGRKCLIRLLGIGQGRLDRQSSGVPDLRFGKRQHKSRPGTFTVDAFLQVCYDSIAETLPDQFLD